MDYTHYTARQLAQDEYFQTWVLLPTPEHQAFWEHWLAAHPYQRQEVEQARALLLGWRFEEPTVSPTEIARLRRRVLQQTNPAAYKPSPAHQLRQHGRVAASVAVVLVMLSLLYWFVRPVQQTWVTYRTDFGEVKTLFLPDGSVVTLNANSRLRFPQDWEASESRTVWLEGEAYFKVTKQVLPNLLNDSSSKAPLRKFLVNANELEIAVVGTQFNVYARDTKTEVVLEEGVVLVGIDSAYDQTSPSLRMQPGEKVTYQQKKLSQQLVKPDDYTSWRERRLKFEEVPLYQVTQVMEETYGVEVTFTDQDVAAQLFTGTVPSSNLDVLLDALTGIYQLQIDRQGDQLIFSKNNPTK